VVFVLSDLCLAVNRLLFSQPRHCWNLILRYSINIRVDFTYTFKCNTDCLQRIWVEIARTRKVELVWVHDAIIG
jgi:hypothetical protein